MESQSRQPRTFSFEFFPPRTDKGIKNLRVQRDKLATLKPRFFSVTFGAGGSTQERTLQTVLEIQQDSGFEAAPHLSCIGSSRENISAILKTYCDADIKHIVALRGDLPSGVREPGEFHYANELIEYIRKETGDHFHIEVAAYPEFHPQAVNAFQDLENFKNKLNAGADSAITQYFFNPDSYFSFIDSCEKMGLDAPIVPGIMPITNFIQLARFSDACGTEIPRWIRQRLQSFGDDIESIKSFGVDVITQMCEKLLDQGAPGLHFYSMNQAEPTMTIWNNLGLSEN